ncbi:MAG: RNA polymerase sigma factor [Armatimonadota bacterium]
MDAASTSGLNAHAPGVIATFGRNRQNSHESRLGEGDGSIIYDHPDFDAVLQMFHKKIYNLIYRLLANPDEAADLTQEAFVKAYKAYTAFDGPSEAIYPWLCKIAVNCCKNKFKEIGRRNRFEAFSLDAPLDINDYTVNAELSDDTSDPADVFAFQDLESSVQSAINDLPPEYRVVIVLRDMQGLKYKEIAESTGLTTDVVKVRLYRARAMLRNRLSAYIA